MKKILLCAMLLIIGMGTVRAQIPQVIAYQGYLSQNGAPYTSPPSGVPVTLILYDAPTNGNQVWSETFAGVVVSNGYYSVIMDFSSNWSNGYSTFNNQYWLSANVDNQLLSPRVQFTASPYSFNARIADSATHVPQPPVGTIVAYAGSITGLTNEQALGWYVCDGRMIARDSFPGYASNVGTLYGSDNLGDSLALPDLRGLFLRGVNSGTGSSVSPYGERTDSLRDSVGSRIAPSGQNATASHTGVGSIQMDAFQAHYHGVWAVGAGGPGFGYPAMTGGGSTPTISYPISDFAEDAVTDGVHGNPRVATETHPKNADVYWLIKVK
jgi:microcystin-dependent protein